MRVIFVPVADRPECSIALDTAFSLGKSVGANVIGCHIRPHRDSPVTLSLNMIWSDQSADEAEWQASAKPENDQQSQSAACELFKLLADRHGYKILRRPGVAPGAIWMEKTGSPNKVLSIMGPVADLLVISRPAKKGGRLSRLFLAAALLKSGRPVLIFPQKESPPIGRRICIAWNQSAEAARAVAAAMPLLVKAEKVFIASSGDEAQLGPKSSQLATYLSYWGVKSERISRRGKNESEEILEMYKSTESDLLVMGAYTRSRLRHLVFGGVTEHMLQHTSIPVFMLHA